MLATGRSVERGADNAVAAEIDVEILGFCGEFCQMAYSTPTPAVHPVRHLMLIPKQVWLPAMTPNAPLVTFVPPRWS
jgi:hypothetical protein